MKETNRSALTQTVDDVHADGHGGWIDSDVLVPANLEIANQLSTFVSVFSP